LICPRQLLSWWRKAARNFAIHPSSSKPFSIFVGTAHQRAYEYRRFAILRKWWAAPTDFLDLPQPVIVMLAKTPGDKAFAINKRQHRVDYPLITNIQRGHEAKILNSLIRYD
jgi:hypothetical protein